MLNFSKSMVGLHKILVVSAVQYSACIGILFFINKEDKIYLASIFFLPSGEVKVSK